jgi:phosphatidylserine decarboxylase
MVGCPINAILDFPMITRAGLAAFLSPKVNAMLKKVLKAWTEYLDSPASRSVLNTSENGWLSPAALKALQMDDFIHDPQSSLFRLQVLERLLHPTVQAGRPANRRAGQQQCDR